jgi:hypothetical protein
MPQLLLRYAQLHLFGYLANIVAEHASCCVYTSSLRRSCQLLVFQICAVHILRIGCCGLQPRPTVLFAFEVLSESDRSKPARLGSCCLPTVSL